MPKEDRPRLALADLRILLVEDYDATRELFAIALEQAGAAVTALPSAEDALVSFQAEIPDVVVSDTTLVEMSGWSMMLAIREMERPNGVRIPAIAVSGCTHPADIAQSHAAGFDVHLTKPVGLGELVATIARLVAPVERAGPMAGGRDSTPSPGENGLRARKCG